MVNLCAWLRKAPWKRMHTCCIRSHTLLHVVTCGWEVLRSLKPVKLLATCKRTQQLPTVLGVCQSNNLPEFKDIWKVNKRSIDIPSMGFQRSGTF